LVALALVAGLGLSHHHMILALGPVVLLGAVQAFREQDRVRWARTVLLAIGGLALGLSPYVYLLWVSHHADDGGGRWVWGGPMSLQDLLRHFERTAYWEQGARERQVRVPVPWMHWIALWRSLERGLLWVGAPVALLGLVAGLLRRRGTGPDRWSTVALVASLVLAGPVMLAMLIGPPVGIYGFVIERLHLLPLMLAVLPLAWGLDVLLSRSRPAVAQAATGGATVVVVAFNWATVPAQVREDERPTVEQYLRNTLAELPPGAVVFGVGDHRCFGFFFLRSVQGIRPDVTYVEAGMLREAWYRSGTARALGLQDVGDDAATIAGALADAGRPVFVTDSLESLVPTGYRSYPLGTVARVLPFGTEPPAPEHLEAMNLDVARAFVREPTAPKDPWGWSGEVDATYARPWLTLSRDFDALGQSDRARLERERAVSRKPASLR
jgi:hypothetical protein